jgi:hypothetical protein
MDNQYCHLLHTKAVTISATLELRFQNLVQLQTQITGVKTLCDVYINTQIHNIFFDLILKPLMGQYILFITNINFLPFFKLSFIE